jgi:L-asparagine transporter-like permease
VETYSDPLRVPILAVGRWLGFTIPTWSYIANIMLVGVPVGATIRLVRRLSPAAPAWIGVADGAVVAFLPAVAFFAVDGAAAPARPSS